MSGWRNMRVPQLILNQSPETRGFTRHVHDGILRVFAGEDPEGFHMSISHSDLTGGPGRYPTWDEIYDARYRFCPLKITMVMLLPPQDEYVNLHRTTFHLWEMKE